MAKKRVKKAKLFHKYRLVFFNDQTFEEVWHIRVTAFSLLSIAGTLCLFLIFGSMALVMFTPMREFVPGHFSEKTRRELYSAVFRLDSVENEIRIRDNYLASLMNALMDQDTVPAVQTITPSSEYQSINFSLSEQEEQLRKEVEEAERFNFSLNNAPAPQDNIARVHFFPPVNGIVSGQYSPGRNHFGIDLVTSPDAVVVATLDGTVIFAEWTLNTGYVIHIQHAGNIISQYKHNASLLKRAGERVQAGEAIGIVGNSGEISTGPHLHFELWYNGNPVNPAEYIVF